MDIGQMRHKISIYTTTAVSDAGGLTSTPILLMTSWAFVQPLSQARALQYGITENYRSYEITLRYRSTITNKQTIVWNSKNLTIVSVINTDSNLKEIKLICSEND
jgi:SPP1 family predicted phage head-tail adaptor